MTLTERRINLVTELQKAIEQREKFRAAFTDLSTQIDRLQGAIALANELLNGDGHAQREQGATALHGDEIRAGEGVKEWEGEHGRVHDDHEAAS
jgi:hypothetical protein